MTTRSFTGLFKWFGFAPRQKGEIAEMLAIALVIFVHLALTTVLLRERKFRFLELPGELRNQIYGHATESDRVPSVFGHFLGIVRHPLRPIRRPNWQHLGFTQLCRQIRNEYQPAYMSRKVTVFWQELPKFLNAFYPTLESCANCPSKLIIHFDQMTRELRSPEQTSIDITKLFFMKMACPSFICEFWLVTEPHQSRMQVLLRRLFRQAYNIQVPTPRSLEIGALLNSRLCLEELRLGNIAQVRVGRREPRAVSNDFVIEVLLTKGPPSGIPDAYQVARFLQYFEEIGLAGDGRTSAICVEVGIFEEMT
ncbi:hypothetical protein K505DRAFT_362688 [Melanomma pulvis-pyrius CBS 109.77]|uniref:F-box domain-containing protein n=1 Tax=Melanomma pulvis-pyrius CBS 109.77 TaxID=1314802 RepID=A0A6A6X8U5_9PLEO|nr:hypothetical protein K505DRAFT_362688 [Melanomma pulvis-pyrius CBS 109.77]